MKSKKASGFGFEAQLSITGKGRYAAAYGLSCKKDYNGLHATAPRRTIPYPNTRPATAPSPKPPNSLTATKAPSTAKSSGTAPKGGNTVPKKPNGKAGLPNGVSGNPISSNGSTRTGGRVSDRAGIKKRPNRRQRSEKRIIGLGRTRYPPYHHLQIEEPPSRRYCPDSR